MKGAHILYPGGIGVWKLFMASRYGVNVEDIKKGRATRNGPLWARKQSLSLHFYTNILLRSPFGGIYHVQPSEHWKGWGDYDRHIYNTYEIPEL